MSATPENKYAEKWTLERTLQKLQEIESYALSDDCYYLGQALLQAGLYNDIWAYWRRKWKRDHDVIHLMKGILQHFEVRLFTGMIRGKVNTRVGTFALRHHYGWTREEETKKKKQIDPFSLEVDDDDYVGSYDPFGDRSTAKENEDEDDTDLAETDTPEAYIPASLAHDRAFTKPFSHHRTGLTAGQDYIIRKHRAYNALHPTEPLPMPISYFDGPPPAGIPAIPFEGGYFVKG